MGSSRVGDVPNSRMPTTANPPTRADRLEIIVRRSVFSSTMVRVCSTNRCQM